MDRRQFLAAALAPALAAASEGPPGFADVTRAGARGDGRHDDSAAFQRALDGHGRVWVPPGRYVVGGLRLWSRCRMAGAGRASALLHKPGEALLARIAGGSSHPADNVRDVVLEGLAFHGRTLAEGFVEQKHLVFVAGASRMAVRGCFFRAFQGDAILVHGNEWASGAERHNEDIEVSGCDFDGVNWQNRQGVSVTDGVRVAIRGNRFRNCSRHDMPGAVDIEPELAHHVVREVRIAGNHFDNVLGGVGAVCVILASGHYEAHPSGIEISGNRIEGRARTLGIVAKAFVDGASAPPLALVVEGNEIRETHHGFEFSGVNGAAFRRNRVFGTAVAAVLSAPHRGRAANVAIEDNHFEQVGQHDDAALRVHPTAGLVIAGNRFVRCAALAAGPGREVDFAAPARRAGV